MALGYNRVLGDPNLKPEARPHRVGIANWPCMPKNDRTATLDALFGYLHANGYEGVEFGPGFFKGHFPDASLAVAARRGRQALEKHGLQLFGSTNHTGDQAMRQHGWLEGEVESYKLISDMGGGFVSYQISLPANMLNTGGAYREDEKYLRWMAERIRELRDAAWDAGLNFYNEVHVDRVTEDPAACCRLLDLATCELNGDLSHLLARGITQGHHVEKVLKHMGHTHVRLARKYGDLSAVCDDPKADWEAKGVTWQIFQLMMGGLAGGLSSRTISGESGPMHLQTDPLSQDVKLVPLYRAMARWADASAQGIAIEVNEPSDLRPWG